jgi:hypothetical protein
MSGYYPDDSDHEAVTSLSPGSVPASLRCRHDAPDHPDGADRRMAAAPRAVAGITYFRHLCRSGQVLGTMLSVVDRSSGR